MARIALANSCLCICVFFHFRIRVNSGDVKAISDFYFPNIVPGKHGWLQSKRTPRNIKRNEKVGEDMYSLNLVTGFRNYRLCWSPFYLFTPFLLSNRALLWTRDHIPFSAKLSVWHTSMVSPLPQGHKKAVSFRTPFSRTSNCIMK